jgi:hypothetical protein
MQQDFNDFRVKYPNAFITDNAPYSFRMFGFECGAGWKNLLEPVFKQIHENNVEKLLKSQNGETFFTQIRQVKEKYGTLRFYVDCGSDELYSLISEAEDKSAETCEQCGGPAKLRGHGWYYTACEDHIKESDK